jgi:chitinase
VIFGTDKDLIDDAQLNARDLENLQKLKNINPDLKILISVGGWTWSKNFSDAALTEESREKFARSAVDFLVRYKLDGVDLDWEYPGQIGDNNVFRKEDRENFTLMLKRTRELLDEQSENDGKTGDDKYLLTIATGANQAYIDNTDLGEAHKYLDFINIMTYDYHSGLDSLTGHHANLYPSDTPGSTNHSIVNSVKIHMDAGVPVEKLVLGVPFYGRRWSGVNPGNNGLYQPAKSVGSTVSYNKIVTMATEENGFSNFWDESAQAPYLFNEQEQIFISYEDKRSLNLKLNWLIEKNMGGVMFWEYAEDYNAELLSTINTALNE